MRPSDEILYRDLTNAGLTALAERAANGEWNDFFGAHDLPAVALVEALRNEIVVAHAVRKALIANVVDGKYDGTAAESEEWSASPEGQDAFNQLTRGGRS